MGAEYMGSNQQTIDARITSINIKLVKLPSRKKSFSNNKKLK